MDVAVSVISEVMVCSSVTVDAGRVTAWVMVTPGRVSVVMQVVVDPGRVFVEVAVSVTSEVMVCSSVTVDAGRVTAWVMVTPGRVSVVIHVVPGKVWVEVTVDGALVCVTVCNSQYFVSEIRWQEDFVRWSSRW